MCETSLGYNERMATTNERRFGSIQRRGPGRYQLRLFTGYDGEGKRQYKNKTVVGTKKDAEDALAELRTQHTQGQLTGRTHEAVRIKDLLELVLTDYRNNDKDLRWAESVIRVRLMPFFGELRTVKVSSDTLDKYVAQCKSENQPNATINRALALLRRAFNLGRKHKPPLVINPPKVSLLKENNVRKGFFEDSEYRALRDSLDDDVKPVLTFAYFTGCRRSEILGLKWSQVDLQDLAVRLDPGTTKNDEGRTIPLTGELLTVLQAEKAKRDVLTPRCPWVFNREGEPIADLRPAWRRASRKAGLWENEKPTRLFHDLRRTGVRNLIRSGVPEKVAMKISGHKTRSIFERYNIVNEADLKQAMRKLDQYIAEKRATEAKVSHTIRTQKAPARAKSNLN